MLLGSWYWYGLRNYFLISHNRKTLLIIWKLNHYYDDKTYTTLSVASCMLHSAHSYTHNLYRLLTDCYIMTKLPGIFLVELIQLIRFCSFQFQRSVNTHNSLLARNYCKEFTTTSLDYSYVSYWLCMAIFSSYLIASTNFWCWSNNWLTITSCAILALIYYYI